METQTAFYSLLVMVGAMGRRIGELKFQRAQYRLNDPAYNPDECPTSVLIDGLEIASIDAFACFTDAHSPALGGMRKNAREVYIREMRNGARSARFHDKLPMRMYNQGYAAGSRYNK